MSHPHDPLEWSRNCFYDLSLIQDNDIQGLVDRAAAMHRHPTNLITDSSNASLQKKIEMSVDRVGSSGKLKFPGSYEVTLRMAENKKWRIAITVAAEFLSVERETANFATVTTNAMKIAICIRSAASCLMN